MVRRSCTARRDKWPIVREGTLMAALLAPPTTVAADDDADEECGGTGWMPAMATEEEAAARRRHNGPRHWQPTVSSRPLPSPLDLLSHAHARTRHEIAPQCICIAASHPGLFLGCSFRVRRRCFVVAFVAAAAAVAVGWFPPRARFRSRRRGVDIFSVQHVGWADG